MESIKKQMFVLFALVKTLKIFGSVTPIQIARAIREQKGYEIDRKRITIVDEVKELGTYKANIDLGNNNLIEIDFNVIGE